MVIKSAAKINFGLRILKKRSDGMHDLHTLFLPLDNLYDELSIEKSDATSFHSNIDSLNFDNHNLIYKAHKSIEEEAGKSLPVKIILHKNIPIGGGMGGGSSNAAATLIALNKLFDLNVGITRLQEIALTLGADVPFFLYGKPAVGTSLGETLAPFDFPKGLTIAIVNPGVHISTAEAFSEIEPADEFLPFDKIIKDGVIDFEFCKGNIVNDFEKSAFAKFPEIETIKNSFYSYGAVFSLMSGTGSTVFGFFSDKEKVLNCFSHFPDNYFKKIATCNSRFWLKR